MKLAPLKREAQDCSGPRALLHLSVVDEFVILIALAITAALAAYIGAPPLIRIPLGLIFVLFLPGYALTASLFPARNGPDSLERIGLSFGLSLATTPLVALGIEYTPWSLHRTSILIGLLAVTIIAALIMALRRSRLAPAERYAVDIPWPDIRPVRTWDRTTKGALLGLVLASVLIGSSGVWIVASRLQEEPSTAFALLNATGEAAFYPRRIDPNNPVTVILEVTNREGHAEHYWIGVGVDGQQVERSATFVVDDGETRRQPFQLAVAITDEDIPLIFNLYRIADDPQGAPYRQLRLIVGGAAAMTPTTADPQSTPSSISRPGISPPIAGSAHAALLPIAVGREQ